MLQKYKWSMASTPLYLHRLFPPFAVYAVVYAGAYSGAIQTPPRFTATPVI